MKIIVTGVSGQLGNELIRQLTHGGCELGALPECYQNAEVFGVDLPDFDLRKKDSVDETVDRIKPDLVLHCAAHTAVDDCEDHPELAMQINAEGTQYLAQACEKYASKLVYVSTDYVFDGESDRPYLESDPCKPGSVYGESKYRGELYAMEFCKKTIVLRTAWMYGDHGKNFVKTILKKGAAGDPLYVVEDQIGCPSSTKDVAYSMLCLAAKVDSGIYHCVGAGQCSWYEYAKTILQEAGISCAVMPCATGEYPVKAKRPRYSVLAQDKLSSKINFQPRPWNVALKEYINRLGDLT